MTRSPVIGLLTDFGMRDWYVAAMKAVILSRCPQAQLIDVTHDIPPQDVVAGAFVLAGAVPWFPRGAVVVAVVDPGVGGPRGLVAAEMDGRYLLGPDNGLLTLSLAHAARTRVVRLTRAQYWLPAVSRTFQGRDILAPIAARLAGGFALSRLGVRVSRLKPLDLPEIRRGDRSDTGQIVHIDAFGNLITNLPGSLLAGGRSTLRYRGGRVRVVGTYGEGSPGEMVGLIGSLGLIELAVRNGSAAHTVAGSRGDRVSVQVSGRTRSGVRRVRRR